MAKGGRPYEAHDDLAVLRSAIENGNRDKIELIVKTHGIEAFDRDKRTAILWSAYFGKMEILKWLISIGANVNHQGKIGYSCLHFCAQERTIEVAKYLLENGANPNVLDQHENSPLWTAIFNSKENFDLVGLLRLNGSNTKTKNKHGKSPDDLAVSIYGEEIDTLIEI